MISKFLYKFHQRKIKRNNVYIIILLYNYLNIICKRSKLYEMMPDEAYDTFKGVYKTC